MSSPETPASEDDEADRQEAGAVAQVSGSRTVVVEQHADLRDALVALAADATLTLADRDDPLAYPLEIRTDLDLTVLEDCDE